MSQQWAGLSLQPEVVIGRALAVSVHPLAAWRSSMRSARILLLTVYFAVGYVAVLAGLFLLA
jgi:hypothetical protein